MNQKKGFLQEIVRHYACKDQGRRNDLRPVPYVRAGSTAGRGGKGTQISHTHMIRCEPSSLIHGRQACIIFSHDVN